MSHNLILQGKDQVVIYIFLKKSQANIIKGSSDGLSNAFCFLSLSAIELLRRLFLPEFVKK